MKNLLLQISGLRAAAVAGIISAGTAEGLIKRLIADFNREVNG